MTLKSTDPSFNVETIWRQPLEFLLVMSAVADVRFKVTSCVVFNSDIAPDATELNGFVGASHWFGMSLAGSLVATGIMYSLQSIPSMNGRVMANAFYGFVVIVTHSG